MKNILHVTRTMKIGGTEKMILQICESTKKQFDNIVVCALPGENVPVLEALGVKFYEIPDMDKKNPIVMLKIFFSIKKIMKKENIQVLHAHHRMAALFCKLANKFHNCSLIYNAHTIHDNRVKLTKYSLSGFHIIADGSMVYKNLTEFFGVDPDNIQTIYNTVDEFDGTISKNPVLEKCAQEGYFLIGNIGRLSQQKGIDIFVQAIPLILSRFDKARFFIVGDGEDLSKIKELIQELKIEEYVYLLGFQTQIKSIIAQLDLLVLSSRWEGLPLTPMEAFSVGKTIVASDIDGTNEIVKNDVSGLLFESENPEDLARQVCRFAQDPQLLNAYNEKAYTYYKENLSYEIFQNKYMKFYDKYVYQDDNRLE